MAIQDAELHNKYHAEHASIPSSYRSVFTGSHRHTPRVEEVALGKKLPFQFSVEDHVSALPDGPRLEPPRSAPEVPWGAVAASILGGGLFAAGEIALKKRMTWRNWVTLNSTLALGTACAVQTTEANAPFYLSAGSAVELVDSYGAKLVNGSISNASCDVPTGGVTNISFANQETKENLDAIVCKADISARGVDSINGAPVLVLKTGKVLLMGHFRIASNGEQAAGQLYELTKDGDILEMPGNDFEVNINKDKKITSFLWMKVDNTLYDIPNTTAATAIPMLQAFYVPGLMSVDAVIQAALIVAQPTEAIIPVEATATPKPPELKVSDDVKAILEAQKAPYTVDAEGKPVIDLEDTSAKEQIVLEQIGHTPAPEFGLDILNGYDKDDTRYAFSENFGWVKYVEGGTDQNPTEIPANYVDDGILNTIIALKYTENPTMSEIETQPQYQFELWNSPTSGFGGAITITSQQNNVERQNDFGYNGVYKLSGKNIYVLPITFKNPTEANKSQKTNVFGGLSQTKFDHLKNDIKSQKTGKSILSHIIDRTFNSEPWLGIPNNHLQVNSEYSDILNIYPLGTILKIFPQSEFDAITSVIAKRENNLPLSDSEWEIMLDSGIPTGLSNKIVPLMFDNVD
ncbi:MAG: hypothetical protein AAB492_00215 [Patescibacteria group bacterium]